MDRRKALLDKLLALDELDAEHLPVVTLEDYFEGNTDEECIAPNPWGEGRPSVREIYARFRQVASRDDVAGVHVGLHHSWGEALEDEVWPAAENIHVIASVDQDTANEWIAGLHADGILAGDWPCGRHAAAPVVPEGFRLYTVYWD